MKRKVATLDATPPKEIFRSIIVDYDVRLGICELIDNALDVWTKGGSKKSLLIKVKLDEKQQKITIEDNAGGIGENDILLFVSPGRTGNTAREETIGIFGVGSKRSVVALAQNIKMRTRKSQAATHQIEYDQQWLDESNWDIDVHEVDPIKPNTTIIELIGLRATITDDVVERMREHLSNTYALFLKKGNLEIDLNGTPINGVEYDNEWAYPPNYGPQKFIIELPIEDKMIGIQMEGGVIGEDSSRGGESGVYFYCNERLIAKSLKDYDVGYTSGKAGLPHHPGVALGRVIVKLKGEAQFMPWNSSKSAINYQHKVFEAIRDNLIELVTYYVGVSRRFQGDWPEQVYKYKEGTVRERTITRLDEIKDLFDIPLPKTRTKYSEKITEKNKSLAKKKPWVIGLYEAISAVDAISKLNLKQKNRFALIMLDSNLEIALKEYLVHEANIGTRRFSNIVLNRTDIIIEVQRHNTSISASEWSKVNYYYVQRNNLVHQKATAAVSDSDVEDYRELVEKILKQLFGLKF
ncbi:MAG: ATP-binding protein [Bacteroidia bacterium]